MMEQESNLDKVSRWWDQSAEQHQQKRLISWLEHDHIKRHINRRITGDETLDWLTYVLQKYFQKPVERAISLGCGEGGLERHVLSAGAVNVFDAYDASHGAIENAKKAARDLGLLERVNYVVADLNNFKAREGAYDAVFASMSIHHIQSLESVFDEVRRALKPSGLFVMCEYIGPTKFQLHPLQHKLVNDLLRILPAHYRHVIVEGQVTDEVKREYRLLPLEWFEKNDPSEAVRSAEIMPVLRNYFRVIEFKSYGGTLLHCLLENIVGNFDDSKEDDRAWLDKLVYFETSLEEGGIINSDFALIVAQPI